MCERDRLRIEALDLVTKELVLYKSVSVLPTKQSSAILRQVEQNLSAKKLYKSRPRDTKRLKQAIKHSKNLIEYFGLQDCTSHNTLKELLND